MSEHPPTSFFTKYLFKTGLKCPTRLYYHAQDYPENKSPFSFIAHLLYNKKLLKKLAQAQFPKGRSVAGNSIEEAAKQTADFLNEGENVLFNPVFAADGAMTKVAILEKKGNAVTLYQVQTKTFNPNKHSLINHHGRIYSKWKDYLVGFAYQQHVVSQIYPEWKISTVLVLPNKNALAGQDNLHQVLLNNEISATGKLRSEKELLTFLLVDDEVARITSGSEWDEGSLLEGQSFKEVFNVLLNRFKSGEKYLAKLGQKCKHCAFNLEPEQSRNGELSGFVECYDDAKGAQINDSKRVFDLIGPGTKSWIEEGIYLQKNIPEAEITDLSTITSSTGRITEKYRQSLQIMKAKGQQIPEEIVRPELFEELGRWEYPIHFLDFEAGNYAVPLQKNHNPYHLVVFQYSCHTLYEDGNWTHHQWIDPMDGDYPNAEFIRNLKTVPSILEGTIVQYSQFERYAIKVIRKELLNEEQHDGAELIEWIETIISRHDSTQKQGPYLADLSRLVKNFYYNHHMGDSLSIKDVLQSVMAQSDMLKQIYGEPYQSTNFEDKIWLQENNGRVMNPYELLGGAEEESVRRGTEAMVAYSKSLGGKLSESEKEKLRESLLRYCELDTLAMLMIYQHWAGLLERNSGTSDN